MLSLTEYLHKKGLNASEIHVDLEETLGKESPSYSTVAKWSQRFRLGFSAVEDDKRTGRPLTVTTAENVERVSNLVMQDRRVSVSFIAET